MIERTLFSYLGFTHVSISHLEREQFYLVTRTFVLHLLAFGFLGFPGFWVLVFGVLVPGGSPLPQASVCGIRFEVIAV